MFLYLILSFVFPNLHYTTFNFCSLPPGLKILVSIKYICFTFVIHTIWNMSNAVDFPVYKISSSLKIMFFSHFWNYGPFNYFLHYWCLRDCPPNQKYTCWSYLHHSCCFNVKSPADRATKPNRILDHFSIFSKFYNLPMLIPS